MNLQLPPFDQEVPPFRGISPRFLMSPAEGRVIQPFPRSNPGSRHHALIEVCMMEFWADGLVKRDGMKFFLGGKGLDGTGGLGHAL